MKKIFLAVIILLLALGVGKILKPLINSDDSSASIFSSGQSNKSLSQKNIQPSQVNIVETLSTHSDFTSYRISYQSDNLKIFAAMNIPEGEGPFPVIVLNHGYYNPSSFKTGDGTKNMAEVLAQNGYLTLASDYRGHGESENDGVSRGHRPEYTTDVLNLIASVKNIKKADPSKIGIWGHSMGGEVSLKTIQIEKQIKAAVLWAPTSRSRSGQLNFTVDDLNNINTPIQLHQGTDDQEVPYEWSVELNQILKDAGASVEFFSYEGQDHNFKNLGWGEISPRTVEFFDNFIK